MLRDTSSAFAADLISLFAVYRSQLLTLGVAICVGLLANVGRKSARERAVAFAWKRPAEADPTWTGAVVHNPTIHADGSGTITAYDPSTGFKIGTFPSPTPQDMYDLVTRAERASHAWKQTTFAQRRRVLRSLLDWIIRDKRAIAEICCRDTGKTMLDGALGEILVTLEKIRWMLVYAEDFLKPEQRPTSWVLAHKVSKVHYEPFGVVGAIVSWNYPFHNLLSPVLAALMSGNAIVMKTSENVAWSSSHFASAIRSCLEACGHDPDVVQVAIGCEAEAAAAFTKDSRIGHLTFIGSDNVGKQVARNAAEALTPVTLELGGKDPSIILASADVKCFQDTFLRATFTGAGQGCIASERYVIHQAVYETFLDIMRKRVEELKPGRDVGSMITGARLGRLEELVNDAVKQGARVLVGGKQFVHPQHPQAHYFEPTLLCDVTSDMAIANEECFAPILVAMRADSTDDCVRIANSSPYGLGSAVFGSDKAECRKVAASLACGMVSISDFGVFYLNQSLPFGGAKSSGYGRFSGPEGLRSLCNLKAITEDRFHNWVQTSIPPPLTYPITNPKTAWAFIDGMIDLMFAPSWLAKVAGLWALATSRK